MRRAFGCDIDGTLALMTSGRGPFDWHRVDEDTPNQAVVDVVRAVRIVWPVVLFTGRMESCRERTRSWITQHVCVHDVSANHSDWICFCTSPLYMRADGDYRPDDVVKREMHDQAVADGHDIIGVFDDRGTVVRMWRELGITVFDVSGRDF